MNERLRLNYLDAMGIIQYAARFPLPNALPSVLSEDVDDEANNETAYQYSETLSSPSKASSITALLENEFAPHTKATPLKTTPQQTTPSQKSVTAAQTTRAAVFHCQIAYWAIDDLLVLADVPRLDNAQTLLLRNILKAIGRTEQLPDIGQFTWPLPQRKEKGLQAAREHFQGLVDGGPLQNRALRQILCFGEKVCILLANDGNTTAPESASIPTQYRDWPIIAACALHEMLEQPTRKADTWRALQILVRT